MQEKREYQRFSLNDSIFLRFENEPEKVIKAELLDISLGGLSIFLKENAELGATVETIVQFDYLVSAERKLVGKGRVAHVTKCELFEQDGYKIGVEFIEVDKEIVTNIIDRIRKALLQELRDKDRI